MVQAVHFYETGNSDCASIICGMCTRTSFGVCKKGSEYSIIHTGSENLIMLTVVLEWER